MVEKLTTPMKYRHYLKVKTKSRFPIDMLRYDRCMPATETDSNKISETIFEGYSSKDMTIIVMKHSEDKKPNWTPDRWKSFSCEVSEIDSQYVIGN